MGKYITKPDTLKLNEKPGPINYTTKSGTPYLKQEARYVNLLGIDPSDKKVAIGRKSYMPNPSYQFSIWQYVIIWN